MKKLLLLTLLAFVFTAAIGPWQPCPASTTFAALDSASLQEGTAMPLLDLVKGKVQDDEGRLNDLDDYLPAITAALERYSRHKPLEKTVDLLGEDSHDLALPDSYVEEFSRILTVEYPINNVPESLVPPGQFRLYRTPDALKLRLLADTPGTTETVRLTFTLPRDEDHIVTNDDDAVACLAAEICLNQLAASYAQSSDPTIQADGIDYGSKADQYRRLAKAMRESYNDHLGIDPKGGPKATTAIAAPLRSDPTRLTHS
ncbi:hypothetical protein HTZ97_16345 [Desulfuromonas acetoxidans]|uniref:Uncharacterized protein n=1 Tax=Desulfuromonas acetoxidans (strain DSM 684 / 11070) TaxID=281689 RepID=Q1K072_DESA6|nr:hypothetical protein [Desulfuromonas acetoxidans]EAT16069.1 hypothetical protein Dace_2370 [Desulfuromonas acetoxidans DSM 684]MBF0646884.1 hypothetical protein [Desulfuromonas acetoxidans]NVD26161.1 hypothetical protein [Desulfuromonas acetoxidans]NVE18027.1 hypothetical protein [Desulfuromonas acetoxidans]